MQSDNDGHIFTALWNMKEGRKEGKFLYHPWQPTRLKGWKSVLFRCCTGRKEVLLIHCCTACAAQPCEKLAWLSDGFDVSLSGAAALLFLLPSFFRSSCLASLLVFSSCTSSLPSLLGSPHEHCKVAEDFEFFAWGLICSQLSRAAICACLATGVYVGLCPLWSFG